ncbi:MAG: hypothetical protein FJZ58_06075 [Chlamydiae bacterium]|nr:hypothetical protein [Chlamydiota bacterium]
MHIRVSSQSLSVVPYISTSWSQVSSLKSIPQDENWELWISLQEGSFVTIPGLTQTDLEEIFSAHASYLENSSRPSLQDTSLLTSSFPLTFTEFQGLTTLLHHDPDKSNHIELPKELQDRIIALVATIPLKESLILPQAEPHCSCPHCQMVRLVEQGMQLPSSFCEEQETMNEETPLPSWDIKQVGKDEYLLTSTEFSQETYTVHLDSPVRCSCEINGCEHIQAVLKS